MIRDGGDFAFVGLSSPGRVVPGREMEGELTRGVGDGGVEGFPSAGSLMDLLTRVTPLLWLMLDAIPYGSLSQLQAS